jgi:hypothetical protein
METVVECVSGANREAQEFMSESAKSSEPNVGSNGTNKAAGGNSSSCHGRSCRTFYGKRPDSRLVNTNSNNNSHPGQNRNRYTDNRARNERLSGYRSNRHASAASTKYCIDSTVALARPTENFRCAWNSARTGKKSETRLDAVVVARGHDLEGLESCAETSVTGVNGGESRSRQRDIQTSVSPQWSSLQSENTGQKATRKDIANYTSSRSGNSSLSNVQNKPSSATKANSAGLSVPFRGGGTSNVWQERLEFRNAQPRSLEEEIQMLEQALAQSKLDAEQRCQPCMEDENHWPSSLLSSDKVCESLPAEVVHETAIRSVSADIQHLANGQPGPVPLVAAALDAASDGGKGLNSRPDHGAEPRDITAVAEDEEDWDACCTQVALPAALSPSFIATESCMQAVESALAVGDDSRAVDGKAELFTPLYLSTLSASAPQPVSCQPCDVIKSALSIQYNYEDDAVDIRCDDATQSPTAADYCPSLAPAVEEVAIKSPAPPNQVPINADTYNPPNLCLPTSGVEVLSCSDLPWPRSETVASGSSVYSTNSDISFLCSDASDGGFCQLLPSDKNSEEADACFDITLDQLPDRLEDHGILPPCDAFNPELCTVQPLPSNPVCAHQYPSFLAVNPVPIHNYGFQQLSAVPIPPGYPHFIPGPPVQFPPVCMATASYPSFPHFLVPVTAMMQSPGFMPTRNFVPLPFVPYQHFGVNPGTSLGMPDQVCCLPYSVDHKPTIS